MATGWGKTSLYLAVFLLVLGGGWFAWRVVYFMKIVKQEGPLTFDQVYGRSAASVDQLAQLAQGAPGTGTLAGEAGKEPVQGAAAALITVVQFADFGCPYSAEVSLVNRAMAQVHGQDVQFVYRNFPIESLHPGATAAAIAAECAFQQGKFLPYQDSLYRLKGDLTDESLRAAAEAVGLQKEIWERCYASDQARQAVDQDIADGLAAGVQSTPTFFINGVKVEGSIPYAIFDSLLAAFRR